MIWCILGWHNWGKPYDVDAPYYSSHPLMWIFDLLQSYKCKRRCTRCRATRDFTYSTEEYRKITRN